MRKRIGLTTAAILVGISSFAQNNKNAPAKEKLLPKVEHAEPLYIDLMRDLGARKGEAEINIGFGIADFSDHKEYNGFIEYEWAVANRLGLEVEIPFSFNTATQQQAQFKSTNKIEGLKLATQYTFLVSEQTQTSMAIGYIHEFELNNFQEIGNKHRFFTGMKLNPIFVAAKKFKQLNTMIYAGPIFENNFQSRTMTTLATVNASFLYVLPNQKNFIGIENNMDFGRREFHDFVRPQLKLAIQHNLAIGLVTGIPLSHHENQKMDIMTRIIWEPK